MSWRTVIVTKRCKLECKLNYLICRGEELKKIFIPEISTIIIESTAVSLTAALLAELSDSKVSVIFCDEKHNPQTQLMPFYGRYDSSGVLKRQLSWTVESKTAVWTEIVRQKITNQYLFLLEQNCPQSELLFNYLAELQVGDLTNREGHAAKVYFNALFGLNFKRGDENFFNSALNYGYSILLSAVSREIVADGYLTQLGLAHKNEFNAFNLSCDFLEPFRTIVDRKVLGSDARDFSPDYKHFLCDILNDTVMINGQRSSVADAIGIYCSSLFDALESGDVSRIKFYEL